MNGIIAMTLLFAASADNQVQKNLVHNAGFELGEKRPNRWSINHRGSDGEIVCDTTRAHTVRTSMRLINRTKGQTGNVRQTIRLDPPLEPGSRVSFSAFAACENVAGSGPRIIFNLFSTSGARQDASVSCRPGTHDFTEVHGEAIAERRTDRLVIYLCHYDTGTVWWDDACVTVERAGPTRTIPRRKASATLPFLATEDGLALGLSDSGSVAAIRLDGKSLAASASRSGLWLHPVPGDVVPVEGKLAAMDAGVVQHFEDSQRGLRVQVTFSVIRDAISCAGVVEDLTGEDRGIDLLFALPVGGPDWCWGKSIRAEVPLAKGPHRLDVMTFSSVSDPATGRGIALAVPADSPCVCEFTHDADLGFAVRFRFGLSWAAGGDFQSRAPFSFVIYRCDGRWGLRDAARRYYEMYPRAFEKRVSREGLWLFGPAPAWLPDPENYAFHEGGPRGWEQDDRHQIATFPYIIPGQREITRLEKLPANKEEALTLFQSLKESGSDKPPVSFQAGHPPEWKPSSLSIVANCLLHDGQGHPQVLIRNTPWGGNSITFPLNANPRLFAETKKLTIAKTLLDSVARMHEEIPGLDGAYVDSLGAWGNYVNYRREHFRYTQTPLTYNPGTGAPVINNRFTLLEFLWALRDDLHARNKLLFANGVHRNRRFHFFALDVMGVEGKGDLEQKRVMAYQKPFLLLIYNIQDNPVQMEHDYHLCTFYGIYPSFAHMSVYKTPDMYAPVAELNNRFVPALRAVTGAGWQPVTHARSSDAAVWLERWGAKKGTGPISPLGPKGASQKLRKLDLSPFSFSLYLTAYNSDKTKHDTTIVIDADTLGLKGANLSLQDLLAEETWKAPLRKGQASVKLTMPPQRTRVLRLSGQWSN